LDSKKIVLINGLRVLSEIRGRNVAEAPAAGSHSPKPVRATCAECGNPLVNGKCRFVNHRRLKGTGGALSIFRNGKFAERG
jgi:hypothetical protein